MKRHLMIVAALACAAVAAHAQEPVFDPAADPASLASAFLKTDRLAALAKVRRLAIAQFRVEFAVENNAKAQSSSSAAWTSARTDIKLVGVGPQTLQAIADQLHDRLVQDLGAAGVEVIPTATLRENAAYQSLAPAQKTTTEPVGTQAGQSIFVGARGQPWYFSNDDRHLGAGTLLGNLSTTQPQNIEPAIAKSLDAAVLRVTLAVAFAEQSSSGGLFASGSSVKTAVRLAIVPSLSQILIVTPDGSARVRLDRAIALDANALEMVDATSDRAVQAAANVITGLFAKGGRISTQLEARTTPEAFSTAVLRHAQAVESAMVAALKPALPAPPEAAATAKP
jgi:hypothetical protein